MAQVVSLDLLLASVIGLVLILMVLLILCWILRRSKRRELTELRISARENVHVLTIKTDPDNAHQLLDQLLDKFFMHLEPELGGEPQIEPGEERRREHGPDSGSESGISIRDVSLHRKGYCYTDRDRETGFSSVRLFTEAGQKPSVHGVQGPLCPDVVTLPSGTRSPHLPENTQPDPEQPRPQRSHPPLGQSASYHPGDKSLHYRAHWSSDLDDDSQSDSDCVYRVVLLGDHGVGKTSLAGIFAGISEKDEHSGEDTYERTLTVDGEETTLILMDTWENDTLEVEDGSSQEDCLKVGSAYVIVYSVTDRSTFDSAAELRITLRRTRQAENLPIILVGNKTDLVRSREVAIEEGRACAVVFDCKFIETSASLQHNVAELFEGVVRQIRLRRDGSDAVQRRQSIYKCKESLSQKARRFLDRLVARNNQRMAVKVRSKSCHNLAVL
ncbi:hypothetical protein Q5P01_001268 [Channa striata]|uniref:Small monomeric GTPase n=1 Tax=Channa striata TaxID=64152 RepID=A0AA88NP24_CHASR|nr:hypothetical protein Q5P01_001268 [Channa striata]